MSRYKNAILRYNPRNFLGLSKNPVNKEIGKSIIDIPNNDFALLNNGITILADEQEFTVYTGAKNVGRLTLTNPQIINGGQTAYTLSEIYEREYRENSTIFNGKEVLVRVVVLKQNIGDPAENRFKFIESISTSTNQQTQIKTADRHSSNPMLVNIQTGIFRNYGYFLELKKGEYYNGLSKKFVGKSFIIERTRLLRSFCAFQGYPAPARSRGESGLYEKTFFDAIFPNAITADLSRLVVEIFYAYMVHNYLLEQEKAIGKKSLQYGYSLRYGKYAVVYASSLLIDDEFRRLLPSRSLNEVRQYISGKIPQILGKWKDFEEYIQRQDKNVNYFNPVYQLTDFDSYYKGPTLKIDIENYFSDMTP